MGNKWARYQDPDELLQSQLISKRREDELERLDRIAEAIVVSQRYSPRDAHRRCYWGPTKGSTMRATLRL